MPIDSDPTEDVSSFFSNLRERYGIEFGPEVTEADDPRAAARDAMQRNTQPEPEPAVTPEPGAEEELDRYPGSKQPLREMFSIDNTGDDDGEDPEWDANPRTYSVRGKQTEFFTISALADALRRKTVTIRKWEDKGYLPEAQFRSPGSGKKQDRLYTRAQIEGLLKIAREERLLQPHRKMRIDQTDFPERARRLFAALAEKGS